MEGVTPLHAIGSKGPRFTPGAFSYARPLSRFRQVRVALAITILLRSRPLARQAGIFAKLGGRQLFSPSPQFYSLHLPRIVRVLSRRPNVGRDQREQEEDVPGNRQWADRVF